MKLIQSHRPLDTHATIYAAPTEVDEGRLPPEICLVVSNPHSQLTKVMIYLTLPEATQLHREITDALEAAQ